MKKAKIMITTVAVFAVVGGTLAFRAQTKGHMAFTGPDANNCTFFTLYTTTDDISAPQTYITDFPGDAGCSLKRVVPDL